MQAKTQANVEGALAVGLVVLALGGAMMLFAGWVGGCYQRSARPKPASTFDRYQQSSDERILDVLVRHEKAEAARFQAQQQTRWVCFHEPGLDGMVCRVFD